MAGKYKYCLSPMHFLEIITLTSEMFGESQLYPRKKQKLKRKRLIEQQQPDWPGHKMSARFVLDLEQMFISAAKLYPGNKGTQQ